MRLVFLIVVIAVSMTVLAALQATTPPYAMLTGPIRTEGRQGETVSGTVFSAQIRQVQKAKTLAWDQFGRAVERQSSGTWVIVSAELQAMRETMPVRGATIIGTSGRLYHQSQRAQAAPNVLSAKTVQPGLPTTGIYIFEMPKEETRDMTLLLSRQYGPQLEDELAITLEQNGIVLREKMELGKNGI
ncbi:hypothetical protein GAO09_28305 [Rhizobiales bacterium RZME27]|uniref:Uncharacterized protein n=1 Tax=Endobacterium cereale TaxID=2663029 RepID=A0A6A8AF34_9HYPH|nr:hypothetical protein [Endobacterium cereale]MEB2844670.1 hypothetical protein [Endobacterium cereale]MQY49935.1 hypothetical protein [Endobacterium cereale]